MTLPLAPLPEALLGRRCGVAEGKDRHRFIICGARGIPNLTRLGEARKTFPDLLCDSVLNILSVYVNQQHKTGLLPDVPKFCSCLLRGAVLPGLPLDHVDDQSIRGYRAGQPDSDKYSSVVLIRRPGTWHERGHKGVIAKTLLGSKPCDQPKVEPDSEHDGSDAGFSFGRSKEGLKFVASRVLRSRRLVPSYPRTWSTCLVMRKVQMFIKPSGLAAGITGMISSRVHASRQAISNAILDAIIRIFAW
ncbi:hypothetical protein DEU56DRAFT_751880 [Suillus clintonianus]|uniref:uncharacterized protein n=1 Tax=Suillus clintonianus TaxID=1904413 RepID=UPI001B86E9B0|nr:uncharacterized protein DEU56DRAFT_751880 [Suillus clintonianus]KAG2153288.1 hypothetical protein DEU56DRAFT_751880 [Suillus clintonianus]